VTMSDGVVEVRSMESLALTPMNCLGDHEVHDINPPGLILALASE